METARSKVKGKSGLSWETAGAFDRVTDMSTVTVATPAGAIVLRFTQAGNDRGTRKLSALVSTESRLVARARADFGI